MDTFNIDDLFSEFNNNFNTNTVVDKKENKETTTNVIDPKEIIKDNNNTDILNINNDKPTLLSAQTKINNIGIELNNMFVERETLVTLMQLALISGSNLLMLGPPGTGKSMITYELCSRIDKANYFQWMLNKTSDPSEILGPVSVKEMENDKFVRKVDGKLPTAHIAFLDEIFKSNSPTLNVLLTIMNEHIFYNDGKPNDVPLISLIGASNEPPEDDSLDAMYDRFIFRINVQYVYDGGNKKKMHNNYINSRAGVLSLNNKTSISIDEIKLLQEESKTMPVPRDIINKFIKLIAELDRKTIKISDRRQNECFKVMQSSAVLNGRNKVCLDDFKSLIYVLWEKESDIPEIESSILKLVNPFDDKFKDICTQFNEVKDSINSIDDSNDKMKRIIESRGIIERLASKLNKIIGEASKNGKDTEEFNKFKTEMLDYNQSLVQQMVSDSGLY